MAEPSSSSLRWRDATARVPNTLSEIALPRNVVVAVVKWSTCSSELADLMPARRLLSSRRRRVGSVLDEPAAGPFWRLACESVLNHFPPSLAVFFRRLAVAFRAFGIGFCLPVSRGDMNQAIDFALRLRAALGLAGPVLGIFVCLTQGFVGVWVIVAKNSQKLELGR